MGVDLLGRDLRARHTRQKGSLRGMTLPSLVEREIDAMHHVMGPSAQRPVSSNGLCF